MSTATLAEGIAEAVKAARRALERGEKVRQETRAKEARLDQAVREGHIGAKQADKYKAALRQQCKDAAHEAATAAEAARAVLGEGHAATSRERLFRTARYVPALDPVPEHADATERLLYEMRELREEQTRTRVAAELRAASPQELVARARIAKATQDVASVAALRREHDRRWQNFEYDRGQIGGRDMDAVGGAVAAATQAIRDPQPVHVARAGLNDLSRILNRLDAVEQALSYDHERAHAEADGLELTELIAATDNPRDAVMKRDSARRAVDERAKEEVKKAATEAFEAMLAPDGDDADTDRPPAAAQGGTDNTMH